MGETEGRTHVLLCVCAGIACYKAVEVLRGLQRAGCAVRVAATEASLRFVGASTWEGLTHEDVATDLFDSPFSKIPHIDLATWTDVALVVPATADVMARMATGLACDLVSSTLLALPASTPVVVAPAMNTNMWLAPATQDNVSCLARRGCSFVYPVSGHLACDAIGDGKLASVDDIVASTLDAVRGRGALSGVRIVVTAGPTHEAIDPVRYIANASSGKMGYAIAEVASARGAEVCLVSGPVSRMTPQGVTRVDVVSAREMYEATLAASEDADCVICAAAVADYTPATHADHKLKKDGERLTSIELVETADILAEVSRRRGRRRVVCGFAAETNDVVANARRKLERKGCDLIVANDVSRADSTFGSDTDRVTLVDAHGALELPTLPKREVACRLLDRMAELVAARREA